MGNIKIYLSVITVACLLVISCVPVEKKVLSHLDTPEHHTYTGLELIEQGKYADAVREFELALKIDSRHSRAFAGYGLLKALNGEYEEAFDLMKNAEVNAEKAQDSVFANIGYIRLYTMSKKGKDWLDRAEGHFKKIQAIGDISAGAAYFMGIAFKEGLEFEKSGELLSYVLDMNDEYIMEANREWRVIQKILRARPATDVAKIIAISEGITRADVAALLVEEFQIARLYEERNRADESLNKDGFKNKSRRAIPEIATHTYGKYIRAVIDLKIEGLKEYPDGFFHAEDLISRAQLATIIEDILAKLMDDDSLYSSYRDQQSPFTDVTGDHPEFNAIMVVTKKGIMIPKNISAGFFSPLAPVTGADALLVIQRLKKELSII